MPVTKNTIGILKKVYPVGCIYISTNSTNPATSFGFGTWSAFGAGRVPVGFDSGQTEFDADEETGGAKTVTLSAAEIPAHRHLIAWNGTGSASVSNANQVATVRNAGNDFSYGMDNGASTNDADVGRTSSIGGGGAHNNLQPYIVVRMWKRTA